jgi:hypothetical protein
MATFPKGDQNEKLLAGMPAQAKVVHVMWL